MGKLSALGLTTNLSLQEEALKLVVSVVPQSLLYAFKALMAAPLAAVFTIGDDLISISNTSAIICSIC
jgi:hypothetical protein